MNQRGWCRQHHRGSGPIVMRRATYSKQEAISRYALHDAQQHGAQAQAVSYSQATLLGAKLAPRLVVLILLLQPRLRVCEIADEE